MSRVHARQAHVQYSGVNGANAEELMASPKTYFLHASSLTSNIEWDF